MVFSTGCDSGSVSHVCASLPERGAHEAFAANRTFNDDTILSISGSAGLSPINKVCRPDMSFN